MNKLREAVWKAAGWGPTTCSDCGSDLLRLNAVGGPYVCCSSEECKAKKKQEQENQDDS